MGITEEISRIASSRQVPTTSTATPYPAPHRDVYSSSEDEAPRRELGNTRNSSSRRNNSTISRNTSSTHG